MQISTPSKTMFHPKGKANALLAIPLHPIASQKDGEPRYLSWINVNRPLTNKGIPINELRMLMEIPTNQYRRYADFKRSILKPALDDITTNTDINIKITGEKRTGRFISDIYFQISEKPSQKNDIPDIDIPIDLNPCGYDIIDSKLAERIKRNIKGMTDEILHETYSP